MKNISVSNCNSLSINDNELYKITGSCDSFIIDVLKNIEPSIIFDCQISNLTINVKPNSKLKIDIYSFSKNVSKREINISNDSTIYYKLMTSASTNDFLVVNLDGINATFNGSYLSVASNFDSNFKSIINHNFPMTNSKIENYGISLSNSQIEFNTTGKIDKGNYKSNCYQLSRGIIAGQKSSVKSLPILLIEEYDVKANHGAAIGKMSDDELFYLMSRGMSKEDAFKLILSGIINPFVNKLLNKDDEEKIKSEIYKLV